MLRVRPFILAAAGLAALCGLSSAAGAACSASTVGVGFGVYDSQSGVPTDSTGTVSISCPGDNFTNATVSLGTGSSGTYASRRMQSGASSLQYNLYTDSARTTVWGNGSAGTDTMNVFWIFGFSIPRTIYGRIPTGQSVNAGTYSDTLVVTVTY
jgi:spore coat protein U-like protein